MSASAVAYDAPERTGRCRVDVEVLRADPATTLGAELRGIRVPRRGPVRVLDLGVRFALAVLFAAATSGPLRAQHGWDPRAQTAPPDTARVLPEVGRRVRFVAGSERGTGHLRAVTEGELVIADRSRVFRVRPTFLDSLWVYEDARRTGALIGAGLGVGSTAYVCLRESDECGLDVGLLIVMPILALIGAGIGYVAGHWVPLIP